MDLGNRITQIEDEIKVLKNEVLVVLLDVKENLLTRENPFNPPPTKFDGPSITINQAAAAPAETPRAVPVEPKAKEPALVAIPVFEQMDGNATEDTEPDDNDDMPAYSLPAKSYRQKSNSNGKGNSGNSGGNDQQKRNARMDCSQPDDIQNTGFDVNDGKKWVNATASPSSKNGPPSDEDRFDSGQIDLSMLSKLSEWVITSSGELGPHNTRTILDISEMMGHIPTELKASLERMIPMENPGMPSDAVPTKVYLKALNSLAILLGKEDATAFVMLQMVSQSLGSMNTTDGKNNG